MMCENHHRLQVRRHTRSEPQTEKHTVDLSGMSMETFPYPKINLATITTLNLSNNNLQAIPESLTARLLNLIHLDVHSNQLTCLPNSIGCLSKLKHLNISANLITNLPVSIENCKSLEELNANFNKLTKLPDAIGFELNHLKKLSINSNKLVFLPHSLTHLTSLRTLDVRLNSLRSLPDDLENLINLETLNLSQNFHHLSTLPYSIGLLISLVELDVSYNRITSLPESLGCLRRLERLSLEGNPLASPPLEVVEHGVHAVKDYLSRKMNRDQDMPKKKSWVKKLVKYGTFSGRGSRNRDELVDVRAYRSIDGIASPRYLGLLSPLRLISSPRRSTSN